MRLQRERAERLMKAAEIATTPEPVSLTVFQAVDEPGVYREFPFGALVPREKIDAIRPTDMLLILDYGPEGLPGLLGLEGHGFALHSYETD
jgi:hypothetical protein